MSKWITRKVVASTTSMAVVAALVAVVEAGSKWRH